MEKKNLSSLLKDKLAKLKKPAAPAPKTTTAAPAPAPAPKTTTAAPAPAPKTTTAAPAQNTNIANVKAGAENYTEKDWEKALGKKLPQDILDIFQSYSVGAVYLFSLLDDKIAKEWVEPLAWRALSLMTDCPKPAIFSKIATLPYSPEFEKAAKSILPNNEHIVLFANMENFIDKIDKNDLLNFYEIYSLEGGGAKDWMYELATKIPKEVPQNFDNPIISSIRSVLFGLEFDSNAHFSFSSYFLPLTISGDLESFKEASEYRPLKLVNIS